MTSKTRWHTFISTIQEYYPGSSPLDSAYILQYMTTYPFFAGDDELEDLRRQLEGLKELEACLPTRQDLNTAVDKALEDYDKEHQR